MGGTVRLYALHCGGDLSDMACFDPFDEHVGTKVYNPYFVYVVTHPKGTLLFDTGAHPDLATNPEARLGDAAADFQVQLAPEDRLDRRLGGIGLAPNDITDVVVSHLHFDHAGGLCSLPQANVFVQKAELAFAFDPPVYQRGAYVRPDFDCGIPWHELDGDHDIYGDGRVVVLSTPGHTRGSQSLMVRLDSQVIILLGDAAYLLSKMRKRLLPGLLWSPDVLISTWDRIEALEREHEAFLITSHDLDFRERIRMAPDEWYE